MIYKIGTVWKRNEKKAALNSKYYTIIIKKLNKISCVVMGILRDGRTATIIMTYKIMDEYWRKYDTK